MHVKNNNNYNKTSQFITTWIKKKTQMNLIKFHIVCLTTIYLFGVCAVCGSRSSVYWWSGAGSISPKKHGQRERESKRRRRERAHWSTGINMTQSQSNFSSPLYPARALSPWQRQSSDSSPGHTRHGIILSLTHWKYTVPLRRRARRQADGRLVFN